MISSNASIKIQLIAFISLKTSNEISTLSFILRRKSTRKSYKKKKLSLLSTL